MLLERHGSGMGGDSSGGGGDPLCVEVLVSEESSSVDESELSESDSGETKTCLDVGHTQKDDNIWMADARVVDVDV